MFLKSLFPSMFHRRLLLLLGLISLSFVPLTAQLGRLSILRADELRQQAEKRLVRRQWTNTVRGSILDREGRVLAQDRPSYDIAVDYPVITGDWALEKARVAARRSVGAGWGDLKPDEREDLVARFRPAYQVHLERAWDALAAAVGLTRDELDSRRDQVILAVTSKQEYATSKRREKELQEAAERGEEVTESVRRAIESRAKQPIAEVKAPHVLVSRVPDEVGFACQFLSADDVELEPAAGLGSEPTDAFRSERVDRVPGLRVIDGGDREYPLETATVEVDRSTFPSPLRAEEKQKVVVTGLAAHILGKVRDKVYGSSPGDAVKAIKPTIGDAELRDKFLKASPAAAASAYTPDGEDRGGYRDNDRVGDTGVEGAQEDYLRGLRGLQTTRVDTGERIYLEPVRGEDTRLTLDILLQARVQAVMDPQVGLAKVQDWQLTRDVNGNAHPEEAAKIGMSLYGAAVVLDIDTGDILAMVSTPTFTRQELREHPERIFGNEPELLVSTPWLNRCIAKPYQPGSIVKPLILAGAITRGNLQADQTIACTGHLLPNEPGKYRCWIYKRFETTHSQQLGHDPDGAEALMGSCNIFYFTLGRRLGPDGIRDLYRDFGIGRSFDLGIDRAGGGPSTEYTGVLGDGPAANIKMGDAIQMGIGQGPVAWTPLHAADAYATMARNGVRLSPRLIAGRHRSEPGDLSLDPRGIAQAMDGLDRAVNDELGTGHTITIGDKKEPIFNAPGVKVWGKTGTATSSPVVGDPDGEGPRESGVLESGDHSWFVIMVGRDRPRYVISVVVDFGGSGGKVSGPIANQIIHALIAEGYL